MHGIRSLSLTLVAASLAAGWAHAQEAPQLDTLVVTGRRAEAHLDDTPQRIELIGTQDIDNTPSRDLTDVLKKHTSVDVIQYPGNLSGIGIRGFRPEFSGINKRSLLLIDGRPAMATNLSLVNMDQVERIEVLKGPASALYGSSAMGGVVNLITRQRSGPIGGYAQIAAGRLDTHELRTALGGSLGERLDFDYAGSLLEQNADFRTGQGTRRPNTTYGQQNHALRLGLKLSDDWRIQLSNELYRGRDIATPGDLASGTNSQTNKDMDREGTDLKLTGRVGDHRITARTFFGTQSYEQYKKTSTTASERPYLPFQSFAEELDYRGWQLQDQFAWNDQLMTVFGVDQESIRQKTFSYNANGTGKAPSSANNERRSLGVYAQNTLYLNQGDTTIDLGLRHDRIETETFSTPLLNSFTPGKADFTTNNPSLGFTHKLGGGLRMHGTVGKGFVPPSALELTGSAVTVKTGKDDVLSGNAGLRPESSITWDMGLEWSSGPFFTDLTVFRTRVKDRITRVQTGEDADNRYFSYTNANSARMEGLEWNGRWKASDPLTLSLAGTHYFRRTEEIGGIQSEIRNVANNTLRAAATYQSGAWSSRFGLRYVGHFEDNDWNGNSANVIRYAPFSVADLSVRYRLDRNSTVSVLIDNLFDRYYSEKPGYPLAGRNGRIAYRFDF